MPKRIRIDVARYETDGRLTINFAEYKTTPPSIPGGEGIEFASKDDIINQLRGLPNQLPAPILLLFPLAELYRADPTMADVASLVGKVITFRHDENGAILQISG